MKDAIREGIKYFTDFTNKWKNTKSERVEVQQKAQSVSHGLIIERIPGNKWSNVQKGLGGKKYKPVLPLPKDENPTQQIRFSRLQSEIHTVAEYLFDDRDTSPSEVGQKCFDDVLKKANRK